MDIRNSLYQRYIVYFLAAALSAHSYSGTRGFRARDIRFFIDVFCNWSYSDRLVTDLGISNTHIQRFITQLADKKLIIHTASDVLSTEQKSKLLKKKVSYFRLTHKGIIYCLKLIQQQDYHNEAEQCLFVCYFLKHYPERYIHKMRSSGKLLRKPVQLEVNSLVNLDHFVESQLLNIKRAQNILGKRVKQQEKVQDAVVKLDSKDEILEFLVENPQLVNMQKDSTVNLQEYPSDLLLWELQIGTLTRMRELWQTAQERLNLLDKQLRHLYSS